MGMKLSFGSKAVPELADLIEEMTELDQKRETLTTQARVQIAKSQALAFINTLCGQTIDLTNRYGGLKITFQGGAFHIELPKGYTPTLHGQYAVYDKRVHMDPSTLNQLLSSKLLSSDEKRNVLERVYPELFNENKAAKKTTDDVIDVDRVLEDSGYYDSKTEEPTVGADEEFNVK